MSGGNKKFVIENQLSYFSHPYEGSGAAITTTIFNGKNYDLWQKAVRTALRSKNKLGFIDGIITKPENDPSELNCNTLISTPFLFTNILTYVAAEKPKWGVTAVSPS